MVEVFALSEMMWKMKKALRRKDILLRRKNNLNAISPITVVGEYSKRLLEENIQKCGGGSVHSFISLKKNFSNMISRNPVKFESNFKVNPVGEFVDEKNNTTWIIVDFIGLKRTLYKIDGGLYSALDEKDISDVLSKYEKMPIPYEKSFNWKYYINLIAEACLDNYDNRHIILLRAMPMEFRFDKDVLGLKEQSYEYLRSFIREVEDYFIEKTHCSCVEEALGHTESEDGTIKQFSFDYVVDAIDKIIKGENSFCDFYKYISPLSRVMYLRLNGYKFKQIEHIVKSADLSTNVEFKKYLRNTNDNCVISDLCKLDFFLKKRSFLLADYYRETKGQYDLSIVETYVEYFKLNMDDILTVVKIFHEINDKEKMRKTIKNICANIDCYPIRTMKKFMDRNIEFLLNYKFLDDELRAAINIDVNQRLMSYPIRLSEDKYIILQPNVSDSKDLISIHEWKEILPNVDDIVNGGMTCCANELNMLSRSWEFYIKRAQSSKGNTPLVCEFVDRGEFQRSIVFLDYKNILESENAIIVKKGNKAQINNICKSDYAVRCDLTPIISERSKIFFIGEGLGDQIRYYAYSQSIRSYTDAEIYYDDVRVEYLQTFNGLDITLFVRDKEFDNKRLSKLLSMNLFETYATTDERLCDLLCCKGMDECLAVTEPMMLNTRLAIKKCDHLVTHPSRSSIKSASSSCFKYYHVLSSPDIYMKHGELNNYIRLPDFKDETNINIEKMMMSCDAVVMHIRCGDALKDKFRIPNEKFFFNCISKIKQLENYANKKYFVFSDNFRYVKEKKREFGLDLLDEKDIYYIDHNRGKNSFWDLKLISLGKIIITSRSGLSRMGVLLSTRKEIFLCQAQLINDSFKNMGWKNKYDLLN